MPTACQSERLRDGVRCAPAGVVATLPSGAREPTRCGLPTMRVWSTSPTWTRPSATARATAASTLLGPLAERGVVGVATTFVDNSGVARVKAVPARPAAAPGRLGRGFVGLLRPVPLRRLDRRRRRRARGRRRPAGDARRTPAWSRSAAQSGWAWAPADRYQQDGTPHDQCGRLLLASLVGALAEQGITMRAAVELEWVVSHDVGDDGDDDFRPAARGPAYGMARLVDASDYSATCWPPWPTPGVRGRAVPPGVRARAARALGRRGGPGVRGRHLGARAQRSSRAVGAAARLPHVVLAEGRACRASATAGTCTSRCGATART